MEKIFTGPGSELTYLILGLAVVVAILWAYFGVKQKDQRPPWLKSSKPTKKLLPGYYVVTNIYEDFLELASPETGEEMLVFQNSHYAYRGKPLSECPKITWELSVPYGHSRYNYKIGSLITIEAGNDELKLYTPYLTSSQNYPTITTGKLTSSIASN